MCTRANALNISAFDFYTTFMSNTVQFDSTSQFLLSIDLVRIRKIVKVLTIDASDSLMLGEKRSELLSRETNPGPLD